MWTYDKLVELRQGERVDCQVERLDRPDVDGLVGVPERLSDLAVLDRVDRRAV